MNTSALLCHSLGLHPHFQKVGTEIRKLVESTGEDEWEAHLNATNKMVQQLMKVVQSSSLFSS